MNENDGQGYSTSEFPLAVTLICLGFNLASLKPDGERTQKVEFVFQNSEGIERIVTGYWNGNLLVEPKLFWNTSRELKSRLYLKK